MWFVEISVSFVAIFALADRLAAVATDDWFGAVRLPTSATLLAVLLVVRLQSGITTVHNHSSVTTDSGVGRGGGDNSECLPVRSEEKFQGRPRPYVISKLSCFVICILYNK